MCKYVLIIVHACSAWGCVVCVSDVCVIFA